MVRIAAVKICCDRIMLRKKSYFSTPLIVRHMSGDYASSTRGGYTGYAGLPFVACGGEWRMTYGMTTAG